MNESFSPITRFPAPSVDGYYWDRLLYPTRFVNHQDTEYDGPFGPNDGDGLVHLGAVRLFSGHTANFLGVCEAPTRALLLWETAFLAHARDLEKDLASLLQLIAINAYNLTIALIENEEVDRAKVRFVEFRDALQGWAIMLNRQSVPLETGKVPERRSMANAYIKRQPDALPNEFLRLQSFLDVRID